MAGLQLSKAFLLRLRVCSSRNPESRAEPQTERRYSTVGPLASGLQGEFGFQALEFHSLQHETYILLVCSIISHIHQREWLVILIGGRKGSGECSRRIRPKAIEEKVPGF